MRTNYLQLTLFVAFCMFTCTYCNSDEFTTNSDTFITESIDLGQSGAIHGSNPSLFAIGTPGFISVPLVQFDLSEISGTVTETPYVEMQVEFGHPAGNGRTRIVSANEVKVAWDENTTNYQNFGGSYGIQVGQDIGAAVSSSTIIWPDSGTRFVRWDLPIALAQKWIDSPETNHGLAFLNLTTPGKSDLTFSSREGAGAARLTVQTVPEPSSIFLGALLLLGSVLKRKRTH